MSEHISTEEVEQIANKLAGKFRLRMNEQAAAAAIRSLAAERDELRKHLRVLTTEAAIVFEDSRIASFIEIQVDKAGWYEARTALGEEGP